MPFTFVRDADPSLDTLATTPPAATLSDDQRRELKTLIKRALDYLRENAPTHPALASAIEAMVSAVAVYQAGKTDDPYYPFRQVVLAIQAQRRTDPSIPEP